MPNRFHANASVNRPVHSHRLDHVRNSFPPTGIANYWSEHIVETVKVNEVKPGEMAPTESYHTRVYRENAITREGGQINCDDTVFRQLKAQGSFLMRACDIGPFRNSQVRRENGDAVTMLDELARDSADFGWTAALGNIGEISLGYVEDAHR